MTEPTYLTQDEAAGVCAKSKDRDAPPMIRSYSSRASSSISTMPFPP
jgi:hypothetical protein